MIFCIKRKSDLLQIFLIYTIIAFLISGNLKCFAADRVMLDNKPNTLLSKDAVDHMRGQASEIGWGGLFYNHTMSHAASAYMMNPWLVVTATPFLSTTFFLESQAWAVKYRASPKEADARFAKIYRNPNLEMVFSFVFI